MYGRRYYDNVRQFGPCVAFCDFLHVFEAEEASVTALRQGLKNPGPRVRTDSPVRAVIVGAAAELL